MDIKKFAVITTLALLPISASASVTITKDQQYRTIKSNGLPNHKTGQFPNRGNPNSISEQFHEYRVPLHPVKNHQPTEKNGVVGIALNGIPFEPGTAEFWNNDRNWNYEALSGKINLGLDQNNAHVQPTGAYHYHGEPTALTGNQLKHIGYAADGFPIFAAKSHRYKSGWQLKKGIRPTSPDGPGGRYDGTFTTDYEYIAGSGDLDICNGMYLHSQYVYVITKEFPHLPRCLFGTADESFERKGRGQGNRQSHRPPPHHGHSHDHRPPHHRF